MAHGSLFQFKAMLARKIARAEKQQGKFDSKNQGYKEGYDKPDYNFPELSETEMNKVKSEIRKKLIRNRKKEIIKIALIYGVLILSFFLLINYYI